MTSYVDFYHYTSSSGLQGIISSGYIRKNSSSSSHAHFGEGTYGTSMAPSRGKLTIAINNWKENHGPNYIRSGSVDWAIKLKIPSKEVRSVGGRRDILVHKGPIYLKDYEWEKMEVPGGNDVGAVFPRAYFDYDDMDDWQLGSDYDDMDMDDRLSLNDYSDMDDWF